MSMDFNGRESDKPITDQEGVMFAAQPVWERSRKRKGFGARRAAAPAAATPVAPEPRSFAAERDDEEPMVLDSPVDRASMDRSLSDRDYVRSEYATMNTTTPSTLASEPIREREADTGLVAPIGVGRSTSRSTRVAKSNGIAPAAIAAGVVALGALGATGWYMSRDTANGVPELTPGSTTSQVAAAPLTPTDPPAQMAMNTAVPPPVGPPPAAEPRAAETPRTSAPVRTGRARPAATAPSAGSEGVNASTTAALPDGPQPYSSVSPGATAPTQVNPPLVTLPPAGEAPAAIPQTPPTAAPEPTTTPEATPPTESPPQ